MLLVSYWHRIWHSRVYFTQYAIKCHTVENRDFVKNKWLSNLVLTKQRKIPVPKILGLEQLGKKKNHWALGFLFTTNPKKSPVWKLLHWSLPSFISGKWHLPLLFSFKSHFLTFLEVSCSLMVELCLNLHLCLQHFHNKLCSD